MSIVTSLVGVLVCLLGQIAIAAAYLIKRWVAKSRRPTYVRQLDDDSGVSADGESAPHLEKIGAGYDDDDGASDDEYVRSLSGKLARVGRQFAHRLRQPIWWLSVALLLGGETLNFVSYIFLPAFVVAMLNGLNVLLCVIGGVFMLRERVSWHIVVGSALAVVGMAMIMTLEVLNITETIERFGDMTDRLAQPVVIAFLCATSLALFSFLASAVVTVLAVEAPLRRGLVYMVLAAYALSAAWSVLNTKSVGLMLVSPVEVGFYAVIVVPWWLVGVFGQLGLVNWMFHERSVSWMTPLMYSNYATVAVLTSQVVFGELDAFTEWWQIAVACVAFVAVITGVGLVASRKN